MTLGLSTMRVLAAILLSVTTLSGCDSGIKWTDKEYEVHWIDTSRNRTLARKIDENGSSIGRVQPEVIAIGSNDKYVVAKQRSVNGGEMFYFVVERKKDSPYLNADQITQGHFSRSDFEVLKKQKRLPDFSATFGE